MYRRHRRRSGWAVRNRKRRREDDETIQTTPRKTQDRENKSVDSSCSSSGRDIIHNHETFLVAICINSIRKWSKTSSSNTETSATEQGVSHLFEERRESVKENELEQNVSD